MSYFFIGSTVCYIGLAYYMYDLDIKGAQKLHLIDTFGDNSLP